MDRNNQFHFSNFFEDTGIFRDLFQKFEYPWQALIDIDNFIKNFETSHNPKYKEISSGVFVGENVLIDEGAKIQGPAIIGSNSTLRFGAYLRENCLIGENVTIGHAVELKQSIVLSETSASHLNYIGNSILGKNVRIAGGAILANTRLDMQEVMVKDGDNRIGVGVIKFGCIIGDNSFVGANAVINPGTVLSKDTRVFPLVSASGTYLTPSTIK